MSSTIPGRGSLNVGWWLARNERALTLAWHATPRRTYDGQIAPHCCRLLVRCHCQHLLLSSQHCPRQSAWPLHRRVHSHRHRDVHPLPRGIWSPSSSSPVPLSLCVLAPEHPVTHPTIVTHVALASRLRFPRGKTVTATTARARLLESSATACQSAIPRFGSSQAMLLGSSTR